MYSHSSSIQGKINATPGRCYAYYVCYTSVSSSLNKQQLKTEMGYKGMLDWLWDKGQDCG